MRQAAVAPYAPLPASEWPAVLRRQLLEGVESQWAGSVPKGLRICPRAELLLAKLPLDLVEPELFLLLGEPPAAAAAAAGAADAAGSAGGQAAADSAGDRSTSSAGRPAGRGSGGDGKGVHKALGNGLAAGFLSGRGLANGSGAERVPEPPQSKHVRWLTHRHLVEQGDDLEELVRSVQAAGWQPSMHAIQPMLPLFGTSCDEGDQAHELRKHLVAHLQISKHHRDEAARALPHALQDRCGPTERILWYNHTHMACLCGAHCVRQGAAVAACSLLTVQCV